MSVINRFFKQRENLSYLFSIALLMTLTSCIPLPDAPIAIPQTTKSSNKQATPSTIALPAKTDILFAQQALKILGYDVGIVDGIWGPRSARAIRRFETVQSLKTANGHLSEINLASLEVVSGIERSNFKKIAAPQKTLEISRKLNEQKQQNPNGPHLIIVDKPFKVLAKPNPYSSELSLLAIGTGVYILDQHEDNWYEIESINRLKGFIQDY